MVFLLGAALGLLAGLLAGGSLNNLALVRFRWPLVVIVAVVVKELGILSPLAHAGITPFLYVAGMIGLAGWTLWHIDRIPAIWVVSIGILANLAVVLANGFHMPVDPASLARVTPAMASAIRAHGTLGQYVLGTPGTRLARLDDWIPGPFGAAYSPGDVLSFAGMGALVFLLTRRPPVGASRPPAEPRPRGTLSQQPASEDRSAPGAERPGDA
ncbi:MAG: DUF5317 family protein [Candidatus Dormibacteraceae bacterium]